MVLAQRGDAKNQVGEGRQEHGEREQGGHNFHSQRKREEDKEGRARGISSGSFSFLFLCKMQSLI